MDVTTEKKERVWTVIIDRPEARNAVNRQTADQLLEAFLQFDRDDHAAVAVLWGAGGTFCAGADLKAVTKISEGEANRLDGNMSAPGPMGPSRLKLSKPVIAAISGYAVAGGLELACWCDLRVAERDAILGVFCRRFGVPLIDGGTQRLPRLIGMSRALDIILTGRPVGAEEALTMGLVNRVVDPGGSGQQRKPSPLKSPPSLRAACAAIAWLSMKALMRRSTLRWRMNSTEAFWSSPAVKRRWGPHIFQAGRAATAGSECPGCFGRKDSARRKMYDNKPYSSGNWKRRRAPGRPPG